MAKKERKCFSIEGPFNLRRGKEEMLEENFTEEERCLEAYSSAQAKLLFAMRFSKKLGRKIEGIYIGDAKVSLIDPPNILKEKEANEQLELKLRY